MVLEVVVLAATVGTGFGSGTGGGAGVVEASGGGVLETIVIVGPLVGSDTNPGTALYCVVSFSLWRSRHPLAANPATQIKIQMRISQSKRGGVCEVNVITTARLP